MHKPNGLKTRRVATLSIVLCAAVGVFAVAGCEQWTRMEDNQIKLQAMVAANARQLATISSQVHNGQGKLNESIRDLDEDTQEVAAGVRAVQDEQVQFHEALVAGNNGLNERITQLEDNQHSLQGSLAQVADVTGRAASDLTALAGEHDALHETVRANQQELTKSIGAVADNQQRIQTGITHVQQADEGLASDVAALAGKQDTVQQTLDANQEDQTTRMAGLAENQQTLRVGINTLDGKADQAALDFAAATSSLQETLRINRDVLTGQMAAGLQNQQALQAGIQDVDARTDELAANIGQVSARQTSLHETLKSNHDTIITTMAGLSSSQQALKAGISDLAGKTDRVSADIATMAAGHDTLQRTLVERGDEINARVALLAERQQTLASNLDILVSTGGQTALDILSLTNGQTKLQRSVTAGDEAIAARMTAVAQDQQALNGRIDTLGEATQQVNAGVATITAAQNTLNQTLTTHNREIRGRVASLASDQTALGGQLDVLTATTGQMALDTMAAAGRQDVLAAALQSDADATTDRMGKLLDNQQQIRNGLDIVTATTGQAALDVITLGDGQARLEQDVRANRQELMGGLAATAQSQQKWLRQFEATQARVQTMADSLAAIESQIANLQAVVQTSAQDVTAHLGTNGQQRQQFEVQVSQDIQAMFDAIAQLRQVQAALQEQMTQVQTSTESQAENIKTAIEQMQGTPNAGKRVRNAEQPPAELKVSDAGKNVEAPVTQSAE